jgi:hypothetical protein
MGWTETLRNSFEKSGMREIPKQDQTIVDKAVNVPIAATRMGNNITMPVEAALAIGGLVTGVAPIAYFGALGFGWDWGTGKIADVAENWRVEAYSRRKGIPLRKENYAKGWFDTLKGTLKDVFQGSKTSKAQFQPA